MAVQVTVRETTSGLQVNERKAFAVRHETRADGEASPLVEDALETGVCEGRFVLRRPLHSQRSERSRARQTPMTICPMPNPSGSTHHESAIAENGNSSAIDATPNAPATVKML